MRGQPRGETWTRTTNTITRTPNSQRIWAITTITRITIITITTIITR